MGLGWDGGCFIGGWGTGFDCIRVILWVGGNILFWIYFRKFDFLYVPNIYLNGQVRILLIPYKCYVFVEFWQ